jgi:hypothetical protein
MEGTMIPPLFTSAAATTIFLVAFALAVPSASAQPSELRPDQTARARFQVVAINFNCVDETWYDLLGADEVYTVFTSPNGPVVVTRIHDGVDTGDTRSYGPRENCILPIEDEAQSGNWHCSDEGATAPFSFTVTLFENDGDPPALPFPNDCLAPAEATRQCEDDLIGRATLSFTAEQLLEAMPYVGRIYEYTITLGGPCGHRERRDPCSPGWFQPSGPEYALTYRLVRLRDQ